MFVLQGEDKGGQWERGTHPQGSVDLEPGGGPVVLAGARDHHANGQQHAPGHHHHDAMHLHQAMTATSVSRKYLGV